MCIYCEANPYAQNYQPDLNKDNYVLKEATDIYHNCITLSNKVTYYVANGRLQGYHWINLPMRTWTAVQNELSNKKIEEEVVEKIIEIFSYLLRIQPASYLVIDDYNDLALRSNLLMTSVKFGISYHRLAEKIIKIYSKEEYPELYTIAHQLLHKD